MKENGTLVEETSFWKKLNRLGYADDAILLAKSSNEIKQLLIKVKEKEKSSKSGLYLKTKETNVMSTVELHNLN